MNQMPNADIRLRRPRYRPARFRRYMVQYLILALISLAIVQVFAALGRLIPLLDLLAHFQPLLLGAAIIISLSLVFLSKFRLSIMIILFMLLAILPPTVLILPDVYRAGFQPKTTTTPPDLKVMSFNVWGGNWRQDLIQDQIATEKPDILILEEVFSDNLRLLTSLGKTYPHQHHCSGVFHCNMAILSRFPIARKIVIPAENPTKPTSGPLLRADISISPLKEPVSIIAAHMTWPTQVKRQARQRQALVDLLAATPSRYLLLSGDFNLTPWSYTFRALEKRLGLQRHSQAMATWPTPLVFNHEISPPAILPIDHIFTRPGLALTAIKRGTFAGSDHYPVFSSYRFVRP